MCPAIGVYPLVDVLSAGDQVSSTYEGRHITVREDQLIHPKTTLGFCTKGQPVVVGARIVGVALNGANVLAPAVSDMVSIDTEGIWGLSVGAWDDAGASAVAAGDQIYIDRVNIGAVPALGVGGLSKITNALTQIPFGYALGDIGAGVYGVIAVKVHHDPIDPDGNGALLLPDGTKQDILVESGTQNYQIGARLQLPAPDGRIFYYMHADPVTGCMAQKGCFARSDQAYWGDLAQPAIPINSTEVTVTLVAASNIALNELAGGWFGGFGDRGFYQIKSNAAHVGGTSVVITLARPTYRAMGGGAQGIYLHPGIYGRVMNPDPARVHLQGWATVVGIPLIPITADYYFWGQTWGPMNLINGSWGNLAGTYVNKREVHFDWDGAVCHRFPTGVAVDEFMQHAGHVLWDGRNNPNVEGDAMIMIEIHP